MVSRWGIRAGRGRGSSLAAAFLLALAISVPVALPPTTATAQQAKKTQRATKPKESPRPKPANIDKNGVLILVKSALLALDHANKTGNYTVLRDLGSLNFQANTAARLADIFASQRAQKLDLAGIVVLDPQLTLLPQIEPNGMLHMAGFFPSVPSQVNFEMLWEPVNREWRLYGLSVNLSAGGPTAPDGPPPEPPAVSADPPEAPTASVTTVPTKRPDN